MSTIKQISTQLSELKLDGISNTIEVRLNQAQQQKQSYCHFLYQILQDQLQMRNNQALEKRMQNATFESRGTFQELDKNRYSPELHMLINELETGSYIEQKRHVIIMGPPGTGKTHLATALGYNACKMGKTVKFIRADKMYRKLYASRADNSWESVMKKYAKPDLTIVDDFALEKLTKEQGKDMYELIAEKNEKSSIIITSNRDVSEWQSLWHDPITGGASLDRISHNAYHVILDGESNRKTQHSGWAKFNLKEEKM